MNSDVICVCVYVCVLFVWFCIWSQQLSLRHHLIVSRHRGDEQGSSLPPAITCFHVWAAVWVLGILRTQCHILRGPDHGTDLVLVLKDKIQHNAEGFSHPAALQPWSRRNWTCCNSDCHKQRAEETIERRRMYQRCQTQGPWTKPSPTAHFTLSKDNLDKPGP